VLQLDEVQDFYCITLVTEILAHRLVQFGFRVGHDDAVAAAYCLKNGVAAHASGFAGTGCTVNGNIMI